VGAEDDLRRFIAAFEPAVASVAREAVDELRARYPAANVLVYDNYNALAIGFAPTERASDAIFSIAVYPRSANLIFFQHGHELPDPARLLQGTGKTTRHLVLRSAADLDTPEVRALMADNLALAATPFPATGMGMLIVKSVSAKQRPRRPPASRGRK